MPSVFRSYLRPNYYYPGTYVNYPVVYVDWFQAQNYCEWVGGRLPTEAEWERAARGDDDARVFPWGNEFPSRYNANFNGSLVGDTNRIGTYIEGASPFGVLDLAGNVWEWVFDWYQEGFSGEPQVNPIGPEAGSLKSMRGSSYMNEPKDIRSSCKFT